MARRERICAFRVFQRQICPAAFDNVIGGAWCRSGRVAGADRRRWAEIAYESLVAGMTDADSKADEAFMQLLTRHQRELRAFIIGVTPTVADADDILQEVNLALWKKR